MDEQFGPHRREKLSLLQTQGSHIVAHKSNGAMAHKRRR
jgi:hypothetical protein